MIEREKYPDKVFKKKDKQQDSPNPVYYRDSGKMKHMEIINKNYQSNIIHKKQHPYFKNFKINPRN